MYRYTILIISFLLVILFYTIPAYSGVNTGCCQVDGPGSGCKNYPDSGDCKSNWYPGYNCVGDSITGTCVPTVLGCCDNVSPRSGAPACTDEVPIDQQKRCEGDPFYGTWSLGEVCDNNNECNAPVNPDHLMCYQVKDPLVIPTGKGTTETTFFVSVPQFGSEARCKLKGRTREFCAPACKDNLRGDPPAGAGLCIPDPENPLGFDRVCYNIENCQNISGQIDGLEVGVSDQFDEINIDGEGPRLFTNFNPHQICTPALKCVDDCPVETFMPGDLCRPGGITPDKPSFNCDTQCQCVPIECGDGIIADGVEQCEQSADCDRLEECIDCQCRSVR